MLSDEYKPRKISEIIGQDVALKKVEFWLKNWRRGKALLLYGPPGVGKTSSIEALAHESKYDFIEMNASDYRTAGQIREVIGQSTQQKSLFRRGKIFMIDEIDGIAGSEDRGGVGEIIRIIKSSSQPVILTANNVWNSKLRSLRMHCTLVEFPKLAVFEIEKRLMQICKDKGIKCDKQALRRISKNADGDMRSALNDFEILISSRKEIKIEDVDLLSKREREKNVFDVLKIIFKTENAIAARFALDGLDMPPEDVMWWIENNIANEYERPEEIAAAFDALSKADIFKAWVSKRQNWRFRAYMIDMMTGGVAAAKSKTYKKFTRYEYPDNIMILGRSKMRRAATKDLFLKISKHLHCSTSKFRRDYLPFFRVMLKNRELRNEIMKDFGIDIESLRLIK